MAEFENAEGGMTTQANSEKKEIEESTTREGEEATTEETKKGEEVSTVGETQEEANEEAKKEGEEETMIGETNEETNKEGEEETIEETQQNSTKIHHIVGSLNNLLVDEKYIHTKKRNWHLFRDHSKPTYTFGEELLEDYHYAIYVDEKKKKYILLKVGEYVDLNNNNCENNFIFLICYANDGNRRRLEVAISNDSLQDVSSLEINRVSGTSLG